jgi:Protein of unknown function (DUF3159)
VTPSPDGAERPERTMPTLLEQMGGVPGIVASSIPVAVFVVVNIATSLQPALIAALVAGVAIAVWRIARKQPLQPAVSGLLGVGVAAFIAYRTGEARGFYLPGLIYSAVLALAFLVSVIVRWPLAGVVWHGINGDGQSWRKDPRLLRAYTLASLLWTLVRWATRWSGSPCWARSGRSAAHDEPRARPRDEPPPQLHERNVRRIGSNESSVRTGRSRETGGGVGQ